LLARIAAALAASRLEVSAAFINTRGEGEAVDVFVVRDPGAAIARKLAQLESDLVELCEDRVSPSDLVASRLGASVPWATRKTPAWAPTAVRSALGTTAFRSLPLLGR
jgi:hypothetical protein